MIDFRTPHDPFNTCSIDYNPKKITKITEEIFRYYIPRDECLTCLINRYENGQIIPEELRKECAKNCKMNHRTRKDNSKTWIETRLDKNSPAGSLLISRSALVYNFYNNIPFILRTSLDNNNIGTKGNNLVIHHKNTNRLDDRPENLELVRKSTHTGSHSKIRYLMKKFVQIGSGLTLFDENVLNRMILDNHDELLNIAKEISFVDESLLTSGNISSIIEDVKNCIVENKIYEPR